MLEGITVLDTQPIMTQGVGTIITLLAGIICIILGATIWSDNKTIGGIVVAAGIISLIVMFIGMFSFFEEETGKYTYTVKFDTPYTAAELFDKGYTIEEHLPYSDAYIIKEIEE